jgi:hypothetical protein
MFTLQQISHLSEMTKDSGYCDQTYEKIYYFLHGKELGEDLLLLEEWEDWSGAKDNGLSYGDYCTQIISQQLEQFGHCFITIANSSGEDKTFIHLFVLFATESSVYRIDSYGSFGNPNKEDQIIYKTKITEFLSYKQDLAKLMNHQPGSDRISYWNSLFSANETCDTSFEMDMIIRQLPTTK